MCSSVSDQWKLLFHIVILSVVFYAYTEACNKRDYGYGSVVCVCNLIDCSTLPPIKKETSGKVVVYESNKAGARFERQVLEFSSLDSAATGPSTLSSVSVQLNRSQQYQEILGFGGAFTDAAGINILSIPEDLQDQLLESYYSKNGLEYSIGRVPMASCDFSTHKYSYDDVPDDFTLSHFNLTSEDTTYKIPLMHRATAMSSVPIRFFGSPWSAPAWMKTNEDMAGRGRLKGPVGGIYYETWAQYFVKFLQAYNKENITFWGITMQNEPFDGFIPFFGFQAMAFSPDMAKTFIKENLGPALNATGFGPDKLHLMIMDDQTPFLFSWIKILEDPEVEKYVGGIGFHWYFNFIPFGWILDFTHNRSPSKFLLSTEACTGAQTLIPSYKVQLGNWERGENYAHDIIENLLHWTVGWVDWNLALDTKGGPNWVENFVDSPIIVNATAGEFYKQPMYYALAHFSKFLPPGSRRVDHVQEGSGSPELVAFTRPDQATVLIVINRSNEPYQLTVRDESYGQVRDVVASQSFKSYIWW